MQQSLCWQKTSAAPDNQKSLQCLCLCSSPKHFPQTPITFYISGILKSPLLPEVKYQLLFIYFPHTLKKILSWNHICQHAVSLTHNSQIPRVTKHWPGRRAFCSGREGFLRGDGGNYKDTLITCSMESSQHKGGSRPLAKARSVARVLLVTQKGQ